MPDEQKTTSICIASSVAVFLILTSICIILSLSTGSGDETNDKTSYVRIEVANYVPNIAMFCVMSIAIVAMVVFIVRREKMTSREQASQLTSRHICHRNFSLFSLTAFFVGGIIFHLDYILFEFACITRWTDCGAEIYVLNIFQVIFHIAGLIFISCETIICWVMKHFSFKQSSWFWHGLAVVLAANIAQWFDALLEEADSRMKNNSNVFDMYFTLCNETSQNRSLSVNSVCSKSSSMAQWFGWSVPVLFPFTIEFFLLVSENFLDRSIGAESRRNQKAEEINSNQGNDTTNTLEDNDTPSAGQPNRLVDEDTPLLNRNSNRENTLPSSDSVGWKIFIMVTGFINVMYLVLSVIVSLNHRTGSIDQSQTIDNVFTTHVTIYYLFSIFCSIAGFTSCRKFQRQRLRTSFLEYLLLFSTSGVLLQSIKRMVAFTASNEASGWIPVYEMAEILDIIEAPLQILFYFYARDVIPQFNNHSGAMFKTIIIAISISNITEWAINSFLYANLNISITPFRYSIEQWPVFDNAVNPISIFFRFNSALLFLCIGMNLQRRSNAGLCQLPNVRMNDINHQEQHEHPETNHQGEIQQLDDNHQQEYEQPVNVQGSADA